MNKNPLSIIIIVSIFLMMESCTQPSNERFEDRLSFCDTNLPDKLIPALKNEFDSLEKYFIKYALLKNSTGQSYYRVYKKIARENKLNFVSEISFHLLDSLDNLLTQNCFYKLLSPMQLSQITIRHLEASEKVVQNAGNNMTPATLAQSIIDNLTLEDFNLQYYKISSLLAFYKMSKINNVSFLNIGANELNSRKKDFSKGNILFIELNEHDQLLINGSVKSLTEAEEIISIFFERNPLQRAIEIKALRGASYDAYIDILEQAYTPFAQLRSKLAFEKYHCDYSDLHGNQRLEINRLIPQNVFIHEPE